MKKFGLAIILLCVCASLPAANVASDNASNTPYSTNAGAWNTGDNGGTGFASWSLSSTGGGGRYIGGTGDGNPAFGLYAGGSNNGDTSSAKRAFTGSFLNPGETFSLDMGVTNVQSGGNGVVGFNLLDGNTSVFTMKFTGGQTFWQLNDGASDFNTTIGFSSNTNIHFAFTYEGGSNYNVIITEGTTTYSGINFTANDTISHITGFNLFSNAQGGGENIGFNNLAVVPEPSTVAAGVLSAAALLFGTFRRRVARG